MPMLKRVSILLVILTLLTAGADAYYDPYIGRFTQRDPIGDGVNWYAYTYNNPLKFIDPTGLRPVDDMEREALIFTFGQEGADFLIEDIGIDIQLDPEVPGGRVPAGTLREIRLNPAYNSENLMWLSIFIHEAVHIWQRHTNRHLGGTGGEDYKYNYLQLVSLDLKIEEHAAAVGDWFYVSYGLQNNLINRNDQNSVNMAWGRVLPRIGFDFNDVPSFTGGLDDLQTITSNYYQRVIDEIQNPDLLPPLVFKLGQNVPNPF